MYSVLNAGVPTESETFYIRWATHFGPSSSVILHGNNPSSVQLLYGLNAAGASAAVLANDNDTPDNTGDLIELGFFDTDTDASTWTPNTDTSDIFNGTWTPITGTTTIGHKTSSGDSFVGAGKFAFQTKFFDSEDQGSAPSADVYDATGPVYYDQVSETNYGASSPYKIAETSFTDLYKKIDALDAASNPLIGIRFYDLDTSSNAQGSNSDLNPDNGTSRYNTIMNPNWIWPSTGGASNSVDLSLHTSASNGPLDTNLVFEFDNTTYGNGSGVAATALVGTGANTLSSQAANSLHSDDFVASVTYYSGSGNLNLADAGIGDTILSGLSSSDGSVEFTGVNDFGASDDTNQLTLHSMSGNAGNFDFAGNIYSTSSASADLTILKTGGGEQILSGNLNIADSNTDSSSGFLNIAEGTLTLKPGSGKTHKSEFITGAGTLKLDNSNLSTQTIELGFAKTAAKKTFSGALTLSSSGSNTINVGGSTGTFASADAHQEFSGVISSTGASLKKTGSGKLTLSGDSNSYSQGITIADGGGTKDGGILVANHASALGSGTTTVEHGKLAVAGGITVTNTIQGQGTNSSDQKSLVGGGSGTTVGTITNGGSILNIGSGDGQIDVVSPGIALATSMSNGTSDHQAIAGDHNDAGVDTISQSIGTLKINSVGLKSGGVFDWEISNFDGSGGTAGSDWDLLQFDSLAFDSSGNFDINILSLTTNDGAGSGAGAVTGSTWTEHNGTSGFKFLDGSGSNGTGITWGSVTINSSAPSGSGTIDKGYFNFNHDVFSYNNSNYYGDWSVYLDYANNDFYLQYSVVPEPSTYMMVTGLLMLPGISFVRRLRKSGKQDS